MRIPFDSLTLAAVIAELQPLQNAKVQHIAQPDEHALVLGLYADESNSKQEREAFLLISWHPEFARAHLTSRRLPNMTPAPQFCTAVRSKLDQARLRSIQQVDLDRILVLTFEQPHESFRLIAELMGKHSNLVLIDEGNKIVAVGTPVGRSKSKRPLLVGHTYEPPPLPKRPSLFEAKEGDDLSKFEGASPFLIKLINAFEGPSLKQVQDLIVDLQHSASSSLQHNIMSPGNGAYPISVAALELPEFPRASLSIALEQHFATALEAYEGQQLKASLIAQLNRVLLARETAIADLMQVQDSAKRAERIQLMGELILAHGPNLPCGSSKLETEDYEGKPIEIAIDPELTFKENAQVFFDKAKRAKSRAGFVHDQLARLNNERKVVLNLLAQIESESRLEPLRDLHQQAQARKWLHKAGAIKGKKEVKPYEGHRIRELLGPGGATVLYGENAESNDYLTLRVAKPDDYWLHVRGSVSAHVVIRTDRHPEKVGRELLTFAAKVAVQNSPSKHAGLVPVDYTLKKYVRKARGAPAGTALYTHEKTLHVENR